jgi:hypothetical protein
MIDRLDQPYGLNFTSWQPIKPKNQVKKTIAGENFLSL